MKGLVCCKKYKSVDGERAVYPLNHWVFQNFYMRYFPKLMLSLYFQEKEFLRNCVARIAALEPDILMVEKSVSRVAQDVILESGITLILNTKPVSTLTLILTHPPSPIHPHPLTVSRVAQDVILESGITLIRNTKPVSTSPHPSTPTSTHTLCPGRRKTLTPALILTTKPVRTLTKPTHPHPHPYTFTHKLCPGGTGR